MTSAEYLEAKPTSRRAAKLSENNRTLNRIYREDTASDVVRLSWIIHARDLWQWLIIEERLPTIVPPTLIIDKSMPSKVTGEDVHVTNGEMLTSWRMKGKSLNRIEFIYPTKLELIIYTNNFKRSMRAIYGRQAKICPEIISLHMTHTLLHEYCHYLTSMMDYVNACNAMRADEWASFAAFEQLYLHIRDHMGTLDDEISNEALTMVLFKRYILRQLRNEGHVNDVLIPKSNGPYTAFMAERRPVFLDLMSVYELLLHVYWFSLPAHFAEEHDGIGPMDERGYERAAARIADYHRRMSKKIYDGKIPRLELIE